MIEGSCHCGAVRFRYPEEPKFLISCNCSICRRLSALWAHEEREAVTIEFDPGATIVYVQGDRTLEIHSCRNCGCTTHWDSIGGDSSARMAVNFRMCDPDVVAKIKVRRFDGADSWEFLD